MSMNDSMQSTGTADKEGQDPGFLGPLRALALFLLTAGAVGSVSAELWVGHRNRSPVLIAIFTIWVLAPFIALQWAGIASRSRSNIFRTTLYCVMLFVALSSVAIYGDAVINPPKSTPAFRFIVTPLGSWLLMMISFPIASLISDRRSRRDAGAGP